MRANTRHFLAAMTVWNEDLKRAAMADAEAVCKLTDVMVRAHGALLAVIDVSPSSASVVLPILRDMEAVSPRCAALRSAVTRAECADYIAQCHSD